MSLNQIKDKIETATESKKEVYRIAIADLITALKNQIKSDSEKDESAHDNYLTTMEKEQKFSVVFDCLSAPRIEILESLHDTYFS